MEKGHLVYVWSAVDADTIDLLIDDELQEKQKNGHSLQSVTVSTCFAPQYQDEFGGYENVVVHTAVVVFSYPIET